MKKSRKYVWGGSVLLAAFVLWTLLVCRVDVQPIGPNGSRAEFAAINGAFHRWTGVHWTLYSVTDWLGLVPLGVMLGFAVLGLVRLIQRRRLCKVDHTILVLGGFYIAVMAVDLMFEALAVNHRPVLIDGNVEASYPSSTTVLVLSVIPTAMMQLRQRVRSGPVRRAMLIALGIFSAFMVIGQTLSGVRWMSDIVGGLLLSAGLVALYGFA